MFEFLLEFATQVAQGILVLGGAALIGGAALVGLKFLAKGTVAVIETLKE